MSNEPNNNFVVRPLITSLLLGGVGSVAVLVAALRAQSASVCSLGLPWDIDTSFWMLQHYYKAAWIEVIRLQRVSSPCIAQLHATIAAAYLCVAGVACLGGLATFPLIRPTRWRAAMPGRHALLLASFMFFVSGITSVGIVIVFTASIGIIDFDGDRKRMFVSFDNGYVGIANYWWISLLIIICLLVGFWILEMSVFSLLHALRDRSANKNKPK